MPRPRKPTEILKLNGRFAKNPARGRARENEPKPTGPLGDPPLFLSPLEQGCWQEIVNNAPPQVLKNSDCFMVELASRLLAKSRDGIGTESIAWFQPDVKGSIFGVVKEGLSVGELANLNSILSKLGLDPTNRSKIAVPKNEEKASVFAMLG